MHPHKARFGTSYYGLTKLLFTLVTLSTTIFCDFVKNLSVNALTKIIRKHMLIVVGSRLPRKHVEA